MKNYFLIILKVVVALIITLPTICTAAVLDQDFVLFYSNDVKGETEPCG